MAVRPTDALNSFLFRLDLSGAASGYFQEISGIGSENEVVEQKLVNDGKQVVQKYPGRLKWGDITLKRGITAEMDIWTWRTMVEKGDLQGARKNGSIIMLDQELNPIAQWDFVAAWPSKVTGPSLQSDSNAFGVEEIIIVHEGITRKK